MSDTSHQPEIMMCISHGLSIISGSRISFILINYLSICTNLGDILGLLFDYKEYYLISRSASQQRGNKCKECWKMLGAALHSGCVASKDLLKSSYILFLITIQNSYAFRRTLLCKHSQLNHWPMVMNLTFILALLHGDLSLQKIQTSSNSGQPKSVFTLLKNSVSNHILKIQKEKNKHLLL